jgi:hypothetical protein
MPTPKEKATELIGKFKTATSYKYQEYAGANPTLFEHDIEELKNCALISVNEIINELEEVKLYVDDNVLFDWNNKLIKFWEDVKDELKTYKQ